MRNTIGSDRGFNLTPEFIGSARDGKGIFEQGGVTFKHLHGKKSTPQQCYSQPLKYINNYRKVSSFGCEKQTKGGK